MYRLFVCFAPHQVISRLGGPRHASLTFLEIPNVHTMQQSFAALMVACSAREDDPAWLMNLHVSRWTRLPYCAVNSPPPGPILKARMLHGEKSISPERGGVGTPREKHARKRVVLCWSHTYCGVPELSKICPGVWWYTAVECSTEDRSHRVV